MTLYLDRLLERVRAKVHSALQRAVEATYPRYRHVLVCAIENPGDKAVFERFAAAWGHSFQYDPESVGRAELTIERAKELRGFAHQLRTDLVMGGITVRSSEVCGVARTLRG